MGCALSPRAKSTWRRLALQDQATRAGGRARRDRPARPGHPQPRMRLRCSTAATSCSASAATPSWPRWRSGCGSPPTACRAGRIPRKRSLVRGLALAYHGQREEAQAALDRAGRRRRLDLVERDRLPRGARECGRPGCRWTGSTSRRRRSWWPCSTSRPTRCCRGKRSPAARSLRPGAQGPASTMPLPAGSRKSPAANPASRSRRFQHFPGGGVGQQDLEMAQAGRMGRRRRRADALPGVEADVVVVAAGRDEERLAAVALLDLEAEQAGVEELGLLEPRDVQVHVPHHGAAGRGREGLRRRAGPRARAAR